MRFSHATIGLLLTTVLGLYAYDSVVARPVLRHGSQWNDQALQARMSQFYQYIHLDRWAQAYQFRTPAYRRAIAPNQYVLGMERDNASWTLQEVWSAITPVGPCKKYT
jgi:hypothetical protein